MDAVVEARGVGHAYGEVTALESIDLDIDAGEIFVLIGPNGAGKTTLVRTITGTITPDRGELRVFDAPPTAVRKDRLGLLPQAFAPPGRLTGREIVAYYGGLYEDSRPPDAVIADVGMEAAADRWYERLSGGQQRRICVGSALVNDPDLLILDEPTTGIDPRGRRDIWTLLESLREAGRTVFLTTHDMGEAAALADRVGLIADGQLVTQGEPEDLIERHAGASRFVVKPTDPPGDAQLARLDRPVSRRDGDLVFPAVDPTEVAPILEALDREGVEYSRFVWEEPTLEDVYFALTAEDDDA